MNYNIEYLSDNDERTKELIKYLKDNDIQFTDIKVTKFIDGRKVSFYKPDNLMVPKKVNDVPSNILNPRNSWADKEDYDKSLNNLARLFIDNSNKYELEKYEVFKDIVTINK